MKNTGLRKGDRGNNLQHSKTAKKNDYPYECPPGKTFVAPDGGWGWVIVLGGFVCMVVLALVTVGFSILFSPIIMAEGVSSAMVAWIFNVHGFIWSIMGLLVGPFCDEFGWRKMAMIGALLNFLSVFLSSFAPNAKFMFFSYSLLGGAGGSIGATTCLFVASRYFDKRRGFAMGTMALGVCVGGIISPLLSTYLLNEYGYQGAVLIFSALVLNQFVCAMLFQPVKWHMKLVPDDDAEVENELSDAYLKDIEERKLQSRRLRQLRKRRISDMSAYSMGSLGQSMLDISVAIVHSNFTINEETIEEAESDEPFYKKILKSIYQSLATLKYLQVIIISIGSGCLIISYVNFQMWISFAVIDKGHSLQVAAWSVSAASGANIFGRLVMACLSDRPGFNVRFWYMFCTLFVGVSIAGFIFVKDVVAILVFVGSWGFIVGGNMTLYPLIMIDTMGVDLFPSVFGVSSLTTGLFVIVIGPLIGKIRDLTSSYTYALSTISILALFAFCLWLLMPLAKARDNKKKLEEEEKSLERGS